MRVWVYGCICAYVRVTFVMETLARDSMRDMCSCVIVVLMAVLIGVSQTPDESESLLDQYYIECEKLKDLNGALCGTNEQLHTTFRGATEKAEQAQQVKLQKVCGQHARHISTLQNEQQQNLERALASSSQEFSRNLASFKARCVEQTRRQFEESQQVQADARAQEHTLVLTQALEKARADASTAQQELRARILTLQQEEVEQAKRTRACASKHSIAENRCSQLVAGGEHLLFGLPIAADAEARFDKAFQDAYAFLRA